MEEIEKLKTILISNNQQLPFNIDETADIKPLGSGESNDNYLVAQGLDKLVIRVAKGRHNRLDKEFDTLKTLPDGIGPVAYFYSDIDGLCVLAEEYVPGKHVSRWDDEKIKLFVETVAKVHEITTETAEIRGEKIKTIDLNSYLELINKPFFENTGTLLIDTIGLSVHAFCDIHQVLFDNLDKYSLIHADLAPLNSLYDSENNSIRLIDWEFAQYFDPARDFATFFYDGVDYNQGKWRASFDERQQEFLVTHYKKLTGEDITERLKVWLELDKYNSLVWLNWKLHNYDKSERKTLSRKEIQNEMDKLIAAISL